jgi:hypothetical protein
VDEVVVYEAFDNFLSIPTWHTKQSPDEDRFFCALRFVVHQPHFDPEALKLYIIKVKNWDLTDGVLNDAADHYAHLAEIVLKYVNSQD